MGVARNLWSPKAAGQLRHQQQPAGHYRGGPRFDAIGTVYGARHGIEGVLKEELLDLSAQPAEEVALLRFTPAAGSIGTCRYKLRQSRRRTSSG